MTPTRLPLLALLVLALPIALAACASEQTLRDSAHCDGALNTVETTVDDAFDQDGDGYFDASEQDCQETYDASQLDCDDENADVNPGSVETTCNDLDDDCDEQTPDAPDEDGDGATPCDGDCDDLQPEVGPAEDEIECDGLDNDCDPATPDGVDEDADGYDDCDDCDDTNPDVSPAGVEQECNALDDDCNELTPDGEDFDNDGFIHCFDCDDADPLRYPGATDVCEDGIDQDCDGSDAECAPPTWGGVWDTNAVYYACASNSVVVDFASISVVDTNPTISFTFIGGTQPGTTSGTLGAGDSFNTTYSIAGLCTEQYDFAGSFTSATTFTGTLGVTFIDGLGGLACLDCANQTFTVTGTR